MNRQLDEMAPGVAAHGGADVEDAAAGVLRRPDLLVLSEEALTEGDSVDPHDVYAVVEVVSQSHPENDYTGKMRDYPRMGIPCYLLIDPRLGAGVVLQEIGAGKEGPEYTQRENFTFGDTVRVGEWSLDTSEFMTY